MAGTPNTFEYWRGTTVTRSFFGPSSPGGLEYWRGTTTLMVLGTVTGGGGGGGTTARTFVPFVF